MAFTVYVTGVPESVTFANLLHHFKERILRNGVTNFWMKEMSDERGSHFKYLTIGCENMNDAYRTVKALDGFPCLVGDYEYRLSAQIEKDERRRHSRRSPSPYDRRPRHRYEERHRSARHDYGGYSRERSRSPISYEASRLDLEIELLRKQRMIIEEERRILLERKKLDMVKDYGLRASKELEGYRERRRERSTDYRPHRPVPRTDRVYDRHMHSKMPPKPQNSMHSKMPTKPQNSMRPKMLTKPPNSTHPKMPTKSQNSTHPKMPTKPQNSMHPKMPTKPTNSMHSKMPTKVQKKTRSKIPLPNSLLPNFFLPCKILLAEMKEPMTQSLQETFLLEKLVRTTIRRRIAIALDGKPRMPGADIVKLYRKKYPVETDKILIAKHLKDVRASHLPPMSTNGGNAEKDHTKETLDEDEPQKNELNEKTKSDVAETGPIDDVTTASKDIQSQGWVKQEPDDLLEDGEANDDPDKVIKNAEYAGSMDSSEAALALDDKNDEDWAEGVNEWDESNAVMGE